MACQPAPAPPTAHDGFNRVFAQVRGITWTACAATMEVALRRRLVGVNEVSISQSNQTATVTFAPGTRSFSAAEFRNAAAEAEVEVIALEASVCGVVDEQRELRSRNTAGQLLVRLRNADAGVGTAICATGRLDNGAEPHELHVAAWRPWA